MTTMALSFSRLSTFEQCQLKFEYLYVNKKVKDEDNQYTIYGNRVHEALEKYGQAKEAGTVEAQYVLSDKEAFAEVEKYLPLVDRITGQPGSKMFEFQMAIRRDFTVCDWFDPNVWLRSIADVLIINKNVAFVIDWKTGKVKANPTQLTLFALMVMEHFPAVDTVKTAFVWLAHDDITVDVYHRGQKKEMWDSLLPRLNAIQETVDLGVFKATPSGLCGWCSAKLICPSARRR